MNSVLSLDDRYVAMLDQFISHGVDDDYHEAYEWGRTALEQGVALLEVAGIQARALAQVVAVAVDAEEGALRIERAGRAAREALAPYEMAYRGFREANSGLLEANRMLEQSIVDRDLARQDAETANRAKSDFLSRMSHELRTPLNSIIGFAQLLEFSDLPVEMRESVALIHKGGQHLLTLINEVLDIARIESGNMSMSIEAVSLHDVVREVVDLVAPIARQRAVLLEVGLPDTRISVMADYVRLRQVLLNLLSNAIKYNREGGSVSISGSSIEDIARIQVSDTGPGISEFRLERMFTPFDRLGAENSSTEGTGLGLVLSKKLMEAMGGELGVTSAVGVGSTFWIDIDIASMDPAASAFDDPVHHPDANEPVSGTVLYIEDNKANLTLVERILGYRPNVVLISAPQGRLGLELAFSRSPDLILLDLDLPDLPGYEVLRILRADARTSVIPIVVLSADATPSQVARLRGDGARDYLTKPIDVRDFLATIDGCLGHGSV